MAPFFPGHAALVVLTLDSRAANDAIDTATNIRDALPTPSYQMTHPRGSEYTVRLGDGACATD